MPYTKKPFSISINDERSCFSRRKSFLIHASFIIVLGNNTKWKSKFSGDINCQHSYLIYLTYLTFPNLEAIQEHHTDFLYIQKLALQASTAIYELNIQCVRKLYKFSNKNIITVKLH